MAKRAEPVIEIIQLITPDGTTFDLTTESANGKWVLDKSGFGLPAIDYFTDKGPFQHGVSYRDYRLKPRVIQMMVRGQSCNRDDYWDIRTELLNALRPNRDPITLSGAWIRRSQSINGGLDAIPQMIEFENRVYGGTLLSPTPGSGLHYWDGSNRWISVADPVVDGGNLDNISLVVYDDGGGTDELYCGTDSKGKLLKWNGSDTLTTICAQLNAQTHIYDMVVFDDGLGGGDQIFAGTGPGGRLFHYNVGGAAWAQDCAQLGAETKILVLIVYDDGGGDDLYGGTSPNGNLYRYNPAGPAWVQVCAQLGAETDINCLAEYNGRLYAGTSPNGKLYRLNAAGNAWEEVAGQLNGQVAIKSLAVYQGRLYGGTANDAKLFRWNNSDAWEEVAPQYSTLLFLDEIRALIVFNNRLLGATAGWSYLLEYIRRQNETELPCSTLRYVLSDGTIRDLCVHVTEGPEFTQDRENWDEFAYQELLRFTAPDPIIYDPTEQDGPTYTMDPGATGTVNEEQTASYAGTWMSHPTLVITGPINNPIIRNEDIDEFIELNYNIGSGRVVTITLTPGNQTVEDDLGVNLIGSITPESNLQSFRLAPDPEVTDGDNAISIQGTGTDANTDFSFTYYNRYIGI